MRIAVVGAHGTGKTTVCKAIADKLKFSFIPDVTREAYKLNFPINEGTAPETQLWILSKQLELERNTPEPWISEKSLWDNVVYGSYSIKDLEVLSVINKVVSSNAKYDIVFYLPIEFPILLDGLRSPSKKFQKVIDKSLRGTLKRRGVKVIELRGNEEKRLRTALKMIEKLGR